MNGYLQCRSTPFDWRFCLSAFVGQRAGLHLRKSTYARKRRQMTSPRHHRSRWECGRDDLPTRYKSLRGKDRDIHALVVLRNCKVVVELYAENVTRDHNHALYSVTKSILATLIGVLLKSGRLSSLDVSVADIVAASAKLEADKLEKARRIRLKDVMSMASGLEHHEDPYNHPIYGAADRLQFALGPALVHEPGQRYNYSNGDASIADAVAAAAAGKDLLSFGNEVLFGPLGFKNVEWWFRDKAGRYPGGWGLRLRAIDMARFGQLYLQKGRWQDKSIIDAGFVRRPGGQVGRRRITDCSGGGGRGRSADRPGPFRQWGQGTANYVLPKHGIIIALSGNVADADAAYAALVRAVVSAVQSNGPINQSNLRCQQACRTAPPTILRQAGEPCIEIRARRPAAYKIGPR